MEKSMYSSLLEINKRYNKLEKEIQKLSEDGQFNKTIELSKALSSIEKIKVTFDKFLVLEKQINETKKIVSSNKDKDILDLAKEEVKEFEEEMDALINELKILLIPDDPLDKRDVIVEMRGAAGGDEANIFVGDLYDAYRKYAEAQGWSIKLLDSIMGTSGGFTNLSFQINGDQVYSKLKYESGVHRVQRVPATESQGRVHTSTISVAILPKPENIDVKIDPSDLKIDTYKSSGAGGQHVNTTDSAVRITHIPSGVVVSSQDGRSQHDNKDKAMQVLRTKLFQFEIEKQNKKIGDERKSAVGRGDRSEKIRTYNYPQNRITDHRINLSLNSLDKFMEGKFDTLINGLIAHNQKEKLEHKWVK